MPSPTQTVKFNNQVENPEPGYSWPTFVDDEQDVQPAAASGCRGEFRIKLQGAQSELWLPCTLLEWNLTRGGYRVELDDGELNYRELYGAAPQLRIPIQSPGTHSSLLWISVTDLLQWQSQRKKEQQGWLKPLESVRYWWNWIYEGWHPTRSGNGLGGV